MLDWTYSPLVAAFFATRPSEEREECDRAVWRLDWKSLHEKFEFPALSLLIKDLDELFGKEGHFTPWTLMRRGARRDFACLLEPPSLDQRIVAQAAVFTLCSDKSWPLDAFLADQNLDSALTKFVIPAKEVGRMRDHHAMGLARFRPPLCRPAARKGRAVLHFRKWPYKNLLLPFEK